MEYLVVHECTSKTIVLMNHATKETEQVDAFTFGDVFTLVMDAAEVADRGAVLNWSELGALHNDEYASAVCKSHVVVALHRMAEKVAKKGRPDICVFSKPRHCVMAGFTLSEGSLALVPVTQKISIVASGHSRPHPLAISLGACAGLDSKAVYLLPHFALAAHGRPGTAFVEPFWAVRRVASGSEDAKSANCHLHTVAMTSCDVVGDSPWLQRGAAKGCINVPLLCNTREIAEGEELVWVDEDLETKERKEAPVFHKPNAKKRATA